MRVSAFRIRVVGRHLDFWPDTHAQTVSQVSRFSASRAFFMTTPPADHSSGAHMSRRGVILSPLENRLLCPVVVGLPDEPRFLRVRAQRQTRAEATREATGERTSSLFAQGAHSRQARPPAPAGGDESGWMLLRLSVASPSATFPHQQRVFRRRGMGAACTSPKASSAASPETVSPSAGPSLERIPAAGASRRRDPILPPSPPPSPRPSFPARAHPLASSLPPQPRSRRE